MEPENDIRKVALTKLARLLQWADDPEALDIESTEEPSSMDAANEGENENPTPR